MSSCCMQLEPALSIASRLSMAQLLLLLSYILLQSSLPARIGDIRQIRDIVSRSERNWYPRIGEEGFLEMKQKAWHNISPKSRQCWANIRDYLLQERLVHPGVSSEDIRAHLCDILYRIEQVSSHSMNAVIAPPRRDPLAAPTIRLEKRASLVLVCISISVTSTPGESPLGSLFTDLDQQQMQQMIVEVQKSPLFPNKLWPHQFWAAMESLELLFCKNDPDFDYGTQYDDPSHEQPWMVQVQQEICTRRWYVSQPKESPSIAQYGTLKEKRRRQTISTTGELRMELGSTFRRHRSAKGGMEDFSIT